MVLLANSWSSGNVIGTGSRTELIAGTTISQTVYDGAGYGGLVGHIETGSIIQTWSGSNVNFTANVSDPTPISTIGGLVGSQTTTPNKIHQRNYRLDFDQGRDANSQNSGLNYLVLS